MVVIGGEREREIYLKSHISLWEHSSHFRLIGRGAPSVSVVSQLMYKLLCLGLPQGKSPGPHVKDQELKPPTSHTASGCTLPVKVEQWILGKSPGLYRGTHIRGLICP